MNNDYIPAKAPQDSITAKPVEVHNVQQWTQAQFGNPSTEKDDSEIRIEVKRQDYNTLHARQSCMGTPIKIGKKEFKRGLGTHANSEIVVSLPKGAKQFKAFAGIDNNYDTAGIHGTAIFSVEIAGREVVRSGVLKCGDKPFPVDIKLPAGTTELVLKVDGTEDGLGYDQSDWADACLVMADGTVKYLDDAVSDSLLSGGSIPFSFTYGGVASSELLPKWERMVTQTEKPDRVLYETTYTDKETGLKVTALATAFKEYPAVEWLLNLENTGTANTPIIENLQTVDLKLATQDGKLPVVLHQLNGDTCSEKTWTPYDTNLATGQNITLAPTGGRPSQDTAFPFWNMQYGSSGIITAIGWSGQWSATYNRAVDGSTRFATGMEKTHTLLYPGEKIRTPRVLMMSWEGDRQASQNLFRRLMLYKYVPQQQNKPIKMPVCLQTFDRYMSTPGWATEQGQLEAVEAAHKMGCDTYWFDAGWFVGDFPNGVGNWFYKPQQFPNGLTKVGALCKKYDMDFIVWYEPCRVAAGTQIATEHPEWVFGGEKGGLYNLGDPKALRHMTDLLSQRISDAGVTVYREDYNIDPLAFWRAADAEDRQGISEIRFVEGHYAMWDELRARHPGLWIDNCASGGRRIDLETCMRSVPLWRSDTNCWAGHPEWNQMQTIALSQYVPLNTSAAWVPETYTFRSSQTTGLLCEMPYKSPDYSLKNAQALLAEATANRKYYYGDIYPLSPVSTQLSDFYAYQLHRADTGEGMVMAFRRPECATMGIIVSLNAVNPKTTYKLEFVDEKRKSSTRKVTGKQLIESGIELRIAEKGQSLLVRYSPVAAKK